MSSITNLISVGVNGTGTANSVMKWLDADTATDSIIYDNGTNIGIGTSSPSSVAKLHLEGGSDTRLRFSNSDVIGGQIQCTTSSFNVAAIGASQALSLQTNSAERMRIDSSGNQNVNYSNGAIHTYGSGAYGGKTVIKASTANALALLNSTTGGSAQVAINFTNEFATSQYNFLGRIIAEPTQSWTTNAATRDSDLSFFTTLNGATTERMRITSAGQVKIGNQIGLGGRVMVMNDATSGVTIFDGSANGNLMLFVNSSAVGIGTITTNGSSTSYNTTSDYRLKENVVEMTGALDRVDALKPSRFNFITNPEITVDGFLAHQVQEVVPEAITGVKDGMREEEYEVEPAVYEEIVHPAQEAILDEEGNVTQEAKEEWTEKVLVSEAVMGTRLVPDYQGIDQSKLVPLLVGAIQELRAEIELLKNK